MNTTTETLTTTDDDLDLIKCDDCDAMITQDEYDAQNGSCYKCYGLSHRICKRCNETTHVDDMDEEFPSCCRDCGSDEHSEVADDLWENQITDLVGSWSGESYEIPRLRKLLAFAKKLSKES